MTTTLAEGPAPTTAPARPRIGRVWPRVTLACALLAAAGAVRSWQGHRVQVLMDRGEQPAFPLAEISKELGPWRSVAESSLPASMRQGTGSADSISRKYADDRTGVHIDLLALYGRASEMHIHAPQLCYPANGYVAVGEPARRTIEYRKADGEPARADFLAQVFAKGDGPTAERHTVYHTWYYNGRWVPDEANPKQYQRVPGMYKVHADRLSVAGESPENDDPKDPSESFLSEVLTEVEGRMAGARAEAPRPVSGAKKSPEPAG